MFANLLVDRFDLLQRTVDGDCSGDFAWSPNRKENRAEVAFAHSWNVDTAIGGAGAEIKTISDKSLRGVDMRIRDYSGKMQRAGAF